MPSGAGIETTIECIAYKICSAKTVLHKIYHKESYSSHPLPVILAAK